MAVMSKQGILETSKSREATPCISVIVPAHHMNANFERCLRALRRLEPAPDELIVVVDGGEEAVCSAARKAGAAVETTTIRRGPAAARNLGARAAAGDILFFIDSDVLVRADAVKRVRETFGGVAPPDALIGSYDDQPYATNFLSQYKNLLQHYVHQHAEGRAFTFWGACGAVKRAVFLELGGFDERYHKPSIEDIELGYRLLDNGYVIALSKNLQITHLKKWTPKSLFKSDFFCRAIPWSRLILGAGRMDDDLNINRGARVKVVMMYLMMSSLVALPVYPPALLGAAAAAVALASADASMLRFFYKKRGALFAARVPLWHWFYYAYSGLAFGICSMESLLGRIPARTPEGWPPRWDGVL
jgi:GT2 family glycosyltransferase